MDVTEVINSKKSIKLPLIIGGAAIVVLLGVILFIVIQKSTLDTVGADYHKKAVAYADNLAKDPTKYAEYPKLASHGFGFMSGTYQLAEKQQAALQADADYMKTLHDAMQSKAHTWRLNVYTEDTKNQTAAWTLHNKLSANTDITGQNEKKNVMAYRTYYADSIKQYTTFNAALEKLNDAPATFAYEFSALKDRQKQYIAYLETCIKDMDKAIKKNAIQEADDISGKCTDELEIRRDAMSDLIVFINTFMNKNHNVDVLKTTADHVKQHLVDVEKIENVTAAAAYAKLDSKLTVTAAYIPVSYDDKQFLYKGMILRALAQGLLHQTDQLDVSKDTKSALRDKLDKVRVSFTMYAQGGNEGLSEIEQTGAAGTTFFDRLIRIDGKIYIISSNIDNYGTDKVKEDKLRYADCKAVEIPEYVKDETVRLCDNYKKSYETQEKVNTAEEKVYGDNSDLHGADLHKALAEYRKYRDEVKQYDAAPKKDLEAIATKLDNIKEMNKNVQAQLTAAAGVLTK